MLEHRRLEPQIRPQDCSAPDYVPNLLVERDPEVAAQIETYLDGVSLPLRRDLPLDDWQAMREEMRSHLESLIEAHIELGSTREEALSSALRQFGDAKEITRSWRRENALPASLRAEFRTAMRWFSATLAVPGTLTVLCFWLARVLNSMEFRQLGCLALVTMYVAPLLTAFALGIRSRKSPVLITGIAQALLMSVTLVGIAILAFASGLTRNPFVDGWDSGRWQVLMQVPLCCVTAGLGSLYRRCRDWARRVSVA